MNPIYEDPDTSPHEARELRILDKQESEEMSRREIKALWWIIDEILAGDI